MPVYISIAIILSLLGLWFYFEFRSRRKENEKYKDNLDDETLYIDGVPIRFDDLGDIAKGDPEEGIQFSKDTMFREDLMQFEGEFLIAGLPLNEERRLSIDDAFLYILELFGKDIIKKPVLTRDHPIFPIEINHTSEIIPMAHSIAKVMDIDPKKLDIGFFEGAKAVDPSAVDPENKSNGAAGLYYGKNANGKYKVTLADNIHGEIERLIATIAHEFSHIKLLGEERMAENSEELTDMLPLFFGFGIFNSDTVFQFKRDKESWSSYNLGYLSFVDWAYLFALYMYVRDEREPEWFSHLNKTVAKDSKLAYEFILANPNKVLQSQQF